MIRFYILLFTIAFSAAFPLRAQRYNDAISKARFLIEAHRTQTNIPGIQIAVMASGELVWSQGFGYSDLKKQIRVDTLTRFRIASVSKPVTSMAFGKMVEEGIIDPDRDIRSYLPVFPEKKYVITSRHLAASVSGIRHYSTGEDTPNQTHYETIEEALERFENDPLAFEPGSQFLYSSYGWVLLSAVMERAANTDFFGLMENTWNELGMFNTTFDYPGQPMAHRSEFYIYDKKARRRLATPEDRSYMYAGGGYLSTAEDLARMGHSLLTDSYLQKDTRELLITSYVLHDGTVTGYGLGWETGMSRLNTPVVYHSGSMPTAVSHLILYPDEQLVVAWLANTGDHVFFNEREAQSVAELFVNPEQSGGNPDITGSWRIKTTSLRDKTTEGILKIGQGSDGLVTGTITFKRSRKKKEFPLIVISRDGNKMHCVAVSPMFIDFYLEFYEDGFTGEWLHDFNVRGIPEEDEYWKKREITGTKIN